MQARHSGAGARNLSLASAAIFFCGLFLSGCDERIVTFRDTTIPIPKHATWAWRPMPAPPAQVAGRDSRPVISRDVIAPGGPQGGPQGGPPAMVREPDAANEASRQQARAAIEKQLAKKGFTQVSDPQAAEFLVDFKLVVKQRDVTVANSYSGYPGVVCAPYGCYNSWGWGPSQVNYQNVRFREGMFVFEFMKRNTLQLAYRAQGQQPAHKGNFSQDDVQEMIHTLLGKLNGK
jgi:hypothetical protein